MYKLYRLPNYAEKALLPLSFMKPRFFYSTKNTKVVRVRGRRRKSVVKRTAFACLVVLWGKKSCQYCRLLRWNRRRIGHGIAGGYLEAALTCHDLISASDINRGVRRAAACCWCYCCCCCLRAIIVKILSTYRIKLAPKPFNTAKQLPPPSGRRSINRRRSKWMKFIKYRPTP